jgi:dolichyl-phosphate beta-glucosyltransferase
VSYDTYRTWRDAPEPRPLDLSIVIPAFNEKDRIVPTIGAFAAHLSEHDIAWELIVSDDGSADHTLSLVRLLDHANIRVLEAPANAGKGAAVRRGVGAASGRMVLFADADCSTPASELDPLMEELEGGADVAVGSRAAAGAQVANRSRMRRALTSGLRSIVRFGLGVPVEDTQCGFKLFTADSARRLFSEQTVDGFSFDLEVLFLAKRLGMQIAEVPVRWYDAPGSKVDARREIVRFLTSIARIRFNALKGVYGRA